MIVIETETLWMNSITGNLEPIRFSSSAHLNLVVLWRNADAEPQNDQINKNEVEIDLVLKGSTPKILTKVCKTFYML